MKKADKLCDNGNLSYFCALITRNGSVVQLVRMPACHPEYSGRIRVKKVDKECIM